MIVLLSEGPFYREWFDLDSTDMVQPVELKGKNGIPVIAFLAGIKSGVYSPDANGLGDLAQNPAYPPGLTKLQVIIMEIVKHNHAAAKAALGV